MRNPEIEEKALKLIDSSCIEDIEIGFTLLDNYTFKDIRSITNLDSGIDSYKRENSSTDCHYTFCTKYLNITIMSHTIFVYHKIN